MRRRPLRRWTADDDAHLRQIACTAPTLTQAAQGLRRTQRAILKRARRFGGWRSLRTGLRVWTLRGAGRLVGLADTTLRALMAAGLLRITQAGYYYPARISEHDLVVFLGDRRTWPIWSVSQIQDRRLQVYADTQRRLAGGRWLDTTEAARTLGWSISQIKRWCADGTLPAMRLLGHWYVWSADAAAFVPPVRKLPACRDCGGDRLPSRPYCLACRRRRQLVWEHNRLARKRQQEAA